MKYIERPSGRFTDRLTAEPTLQPVDVVMLTLNADNFLEKCLFSAYREIPIRKLFVCDGGSKDETHSILSKFPRVELFIRPDFRTTGKGLEFLFSKVETEWCVILDGDIELAVGWYDEMSKHKDRYHVLENNKMINAYHMYRELPIKLEEKTRAYEFCHLAHKSAIQTFHCDDDFMWRYTDVLFRQTVENSGYKYGKISSTMYVEHETERIRYQSDDEKNYEKVVWKEPEFVIVDRQKYEACMLKHAKAIIKYLDPGHMLIRDNPGYDDLIVLLDRQWIVDNGPKWLDRYDAAIVRQKKASPFTKIKMRQFIRSIVKRLK